MAMLALPACAAAQAPDVAPPRSRVNECAGGLSPAGRQAP
jgi:hypothetical protein